MLRILSLTIPKGRADALGELLEGQELVTHWQQEILDELLLAHLLVKSDRAEGLLDLLEQRFGGSERFRAVLMPVQATVPEIKEEPAEEPEAEKEEPPPPGRVARAEIKTQLESGIDVGPVFVSTVVLSAIIATVGLIKDNVAVIIGAMVVAPLLTPTMAIAFAVTVGDLEFGRRALRSAGIGAGLGFAVALLLGWAYTGDMGPEILSRTDPDWTDLVLALASGAAGALAFTSGVSASLVGVMVAVALLPPLVVSGLLASRGEWSASGGATLLLATNAVSVVLAGVLVFSWRGVRPRTWWEKEKARRYFRRSVTVGLLLTVVLLALLLAQQWRD